jgi:DNA-binding response OmpR family regulator
MSPNSILLVDDEQDIVAIFRKSLQNQGFDAYGFTDPILALEHFKANHPNYGLVISDIRMPQMNGIELARRIREIKPEVKLLLMTAFELSDFDSDLLDSLKADEFLRKPISPAELANRVAVYLRVASHQA